MARILGEDLVHETMTEIGIGRAAYVIENRGRRLSAVTKRGEHRLVSLEMAPGEGDLAVIVRIHKACCVEDPEYLDI